MIVKLNGRNPDKGKNHEVPLHDLDKNKTAFLTPDICKQFKLIQKNHYK